MFLHSGHREVILPTFAEHEAAFQGKTLSLPHLVSKYKRAAERNLTLIYFLGRPGNGFLIRNNSQSQNSQVFSTVHFNIFKMKTSAIM